MADIGSQLHDGSLIIWKEVPKDNEKGHCISGTRGNRR